MLGTWTSALTQTLFETYRTSVVTSLLTGQLLTIDEHGQAASPETVGPRARSRLHWTRPGSLLVPGCQLGTGALVALHAESAEKSAFWAKALSVALGTVMLPASLLKKDICAVEARH